MDLANRDIGIQHLQRLIDQKKKNLYETHQSLLINSKDNIYLKDVADDYAKYSSIDNQKQYNALHLLTEYLTQITLDPTSTEEMLRNCKYDRSLITGEMKKLKI